MSYVVLVNTTNSLLEEKIMSKHKNIRTMCVMCDGWAIRFRFQSVSNAYTLVKDRCCMMKTDVIKLQSARRSNSQPPLKTKSESAKQKTVNRKKVL